MDSKENGGINRAVVTPPENLPATPLEQVLVAPLGGPVQVSQRVIDDVNSVRPLEEAISLSVKKEQWANSVDTLNNSTVVGDARAASPLSGVPTQPNFETSNIPQGMVAYRPENTGGAIVDTSEPVVDATGPAHARIRKQTLQSFSNMTPEERVAAARAALLRYDQEVGMGKDASGNDVPHQQYKRELRRLNQDLFSPVVKSALEDRNGQQVDVSILNNTALMKEAGENEKLRRMLVKESSKKIDEVFKDVMDAAYQKQHVVEGVYARAGTVAPGDGGVTPDWAKRAVRTEQRKIALGLLTTPESSQLAIAKAKEWVGAQMTGVPDVDEAIAGKARLGRVLLRIQGEQEKKAAKAAVVSQAPVVSTETVVEAQPAVVATSPVIESGVFGPKPGFPDTSRLVEKPPVEDVVVPLTEPESEDKKRRRGIIPLFTDFVEKSGEPTSGAEGRVRRYGKRIAIGAVAGAIAWTLLRSGDEPHANYNPDTTSPDAQPALVVEDTKPAVPVMRGQGFIPGDEGGGASSGPFSDSSRGVVDESIGSGQPTTRPEASVEVAMSTEVTFGPGETFGEKMFGIDGTTEGGRQQISERLNDRSNLDFVEATVLANIGENGMATSATDVKQIFDGIREGTLSQEQGWHMLDDVLVRGTPDKDFTYNMPTKAGVDALVDDREGIYAASGVEGANTTRSEIPDFTVSGADGSPVQVTVGDGTGGPDQVSQEAPVAVASDFAPTAGDVIVGGGAEEQPDVVPGKPTNKGFFNRVSRFFK